MITDEDIKKITEALKIEQLKQIVVKGFDNTVSKSEFGELRSDVRSLTTSIDSLAAKFQKYYEEQAIVKHKLETIETWIKQAAAKLGLEYNP